MDMLFWKDVAIDTCVDALKIFPFLLVTYIFMEYLEHHTDRKMLDWLRHAGPLGPVIGAITGAIPQCGFSAAASNLYAARVISMGTLIAVYLSTSDEMLPLLISTQAPVVTVILILVSKAAVGIVAGLIVDIAGSRLDKKHEEEAEEAEEPGEHEGHHHGDSNIHRMCEREHCDCEKDGIFLSALKHSLKIILFVMLITFLMNAFMKVFGAAGIQYVTIGQSYGVILLASLFGLIPNCGVSVALTQLYMSGVIGDGAAMAGLLVGAGVGLLVLLRVNRPFKDNAKIIGILWAVGLLTGCLLKAFGITFIR